MFSKVPRVLPALALLFAALLPAQDAVTAGQFNVEPPTKPISLSGTHKGKLSLR